MKFKALEEVYILDTLSTLIYKAQEENHKAVENFVFLMSQETLTSVISTLKATYQMMSYATGEMPPLIGKAEELDKVNISVCHRIMGHIVYTDNRLPYMEVGIMSVVFA